MPQTTLGAARVEAATAAGCLHQRSLQTDRGRTAESSIRQKKARQRSSSDDRVATQHLQVALVSSRVPVPVREPSAPVQTFAVILGQFWHRMMRSYSSFSRPEAPSFFLNSDVDWCSHLLSHPNVYAGCERRHLDLLSLFCQDDMPRWTNHFGRELFESHYGGGFSGPDPTGLIYHFLTSRDGDLLEPSGWLIAFALVDKMHLEHYSLYHAAAAGPHGQTVHRVHPLTHGTRFYTGHVLRNLFVLYAMAHKWHGEYYFSLKFFVGLLPRKLSCAEPSSSSSSSSSSAGITRPNQLVSTAVATQYAFHSSSFSQCVSARELARIEESFLLLLGHNLTVTPEHALRLMEYFLSPEERSFVSNVITSKSLQKKFAVAPASSR